jgi:hypothetical protein
VNKRELEQLKASTYEKLRQTIQEGDKEKALALLEELHHNRIKHREALLTLIDILYAYGADKVGEEFVYEVDKIFAERALFSLFEWAFKPGVTPEEKLRERAHAWTVLHGTHIDEIQEDDEKFMIKFKCDTGGWLRTREQFGKTQKPYTWSCGQVGASYFCAHCHIIFEIMAIDKFGYPAWVSVPQPEGQCIQYIFKKPESVPEEIYKRVGMKKKTG